MGKQEYERQKHISWNKIIAFCIVLVVFVLGFCYLYFQTGFLKKLFKETYTITFVVEGVNYEQRVVYGEFPEFTGPLFKPNTETVEYYFTHWSPSLTEVKGNATYVANFAPQTRLYEVKADCNLVDACTITGGGKIYEYKDDVTLTISLNEGYQFDGWYKDGEFFSNAVIIVFSDITKDVSLTARCSLIEKNINYVDELGGRNTNPTKYNITSGEFTLEDCSKAGYNFLGWYNASSGGNKIESINSNDLKDVTLYARWQAITYDITYELKGGTNSPLNVSGYTIESGDIVIYPASKLDCNFVGWSGTGLNELTNQFTIPAGSYGDRHYEANYDGEKVNLTLYVDGAVLTEQEFYSGQVLTEPVIDGSEYGMNGYQINNWYTDSAMTNEYTFNKVERSALTLYSEWDWMFSDGFMPYYGKFSLVAESMQINSYPELVAWAEYVKYFDLASPKSITLTYTNLSNNALLSELGRAVDKAGFTGSAVTYSVTGTVGKIYIKNSIRNLEASLDADPTKESTFTQQDYAFKMANPMSRASNYNDFNINNVKQTLPAETTNQLVYAFEKGVRPVCQSGSSAEDIYNKAKAVLRDIISDDMNDIEKTRAIYEWLVYNVEYDNAAATNSTNSSFEWKKYDSWYAEGVFNRGKAVCDGLAKAFVILCGIENIPCIRIEGDMHAWNRVYIDGAWYGVDATHGGVQYHADSSEVLTYYQFMFTDSFKTAQGYTGDNYTEYAATTEFNYYDYYSISSSLDLLISSSSELTDVLKSVKNYSPKLESTYFTIEVAFDASLESSILQTLSSAATLSGVSFDRYSNIGRNTAGNLVYVLFIEQ